MKPNLQCTIIALSLLGQLATESVAQTFTKIDTSVITRDGGYTQGSSWGDFDNDGDEDLFISNGSVTSGSHQNFLYRNEGGGRFTKITVGDIVNEISANGGGGACWGDYDNDGNLDLFFPVFYGINSRLYRNEGNGSLTKITTGIIVNDNSGDSVGSSWVDIDNDGDLDLFVVNDTGHPNFLYRNEGNGNFSKITEGWIVTEGLSSVCGSWADIDNDGDLDLFVANIENDRLYIIMEMAVLAILQQTISSMTDGFRQAAVGRTMTTMATWIFMSPLLMVRISYTAIMEAVCFKKLRPELLLQIQPQQSAAVGATLIMTVIWIYLLQLTKAKIFFTEMTAVEISPKSPPAPSSMNKAEPVARQIMIMMAI
jgi:hypothetical protein